MSFQTKFDDEIIPLIVKSQNALSRFIEEAQVGSQCNIPTLYRSWFGELSDGRLYFTGRLIQI